MEEGLRMNRVALLSRLRAACQHLGIQWKPQDTPLALAERLAKADAMEGFSDKYGVVYDREGQRLLDFAEMAEQAVFGQS